MATGRIVERSAGMRVDGIDLRRQLVGEKGKLHPWESKLELRKAIKAAGTL